MTRKKVKLAYIVNDSARKATFRKRTKSLMKMVSELSTLCGIDACAIVESPFDSQPRVWPSDLGVQRVMYQFKRMHEMKQSKNMMNQESFLKQRIIKSTEKLNKQVQENRENEMIQIMFQSLVGSSPSLDLEDLNDLEWVIEKYLKSIYEKCETFNNMVVGESSSSAEEAAAAAGATPAPVLAPAPDLGEIRYTGESSQAAGGDDKMSMDSLQKHCF